MTMSGENFWIYAAFAVLTALTVFLLVQLFLLRAKVGSLTKKYKYFMAGGNGASLERQLSAELLELRDMNRSSEDMLRQHEMLSQMQIQSYQRSGLVKYDAFDDSGDKLSFSLTLLDGANHGFVLTSLVGRETSRIYVKQITDGECREALSAEEAASIDMALAGYTPTVQKKKKQTEEKKTDTRFAREEIPQKEAV